VYPYYYIVVRGSNPANDFGNYTVSIDFPASDDHADGDTNADDILDTGEYAFATPVILDSSTGQGNDTGIIELTTDSDLFKFTAAASGVASIIVSRPTTSLLRTRVTILDASGTELASNTAGDSTIFFQATVTTGVVRGATYFVVVQGFNDPNNPNVNTTDVGEYTLSIAAPPIDDHANAGEFTLATPIVLNTTTGMGQQGGDSAGDGLNPRLSPSGDTDLFSFTTIIAGDVDIRVTPFASAVGNFAPTITLFDATMTQIGLTVLASAGLEEISLAILGAPINTTYFILVGSVSGLPLTAQTGEYRIKVTGPEPTGGGGDDPADIDFNNPTTIALSGRTGDGFLNDTVGVVNDRDLFTFTTLASGKVFVQITTPSGSLLDASIRVQNAANEEQSALVVADAGGIPGATASVSFDAVGGAQYWVIVDGLGDSTGTYKILVNSQPLVNQLYFPEGYLNESISEFISVINPTNSDATFRIVFRYEMENVQLESRTRLLTIGANTRSGVTMRDPWYFEADGVPMLQNTPYAMVIESSVPLGATLAHYDFGTSIGDTFTERLSSSWTFPRVERNPGAVQDFIVFYNPNNFAVNVKLTGFNKDGIESSIELTFPALRRAGYAIDQLTQMPLGVFGAILTAEAAFSVDEANFQGIVASLSHYSPLTGSSFAVLGDPDGGSKEGVITNLAQGERFNSEIVLFNPNDFLVNVTITPSYIRTALPQLPRTYQLQPKRTTVITGASLGLVADQPVGITYTSSAPVNVNSNQTQQGDADSTNTSTEAATRFFFGDAYVQSDKAGVLYFETLYMHNPANIATTISIRLAFTDGSTSTVNVNVGPKGFAELELHKLAAVTTQRSGAIWFGVDASAATPFNISMVHYDLALGGGWSTSGIPFGPTNALTTIA